MEKVINKKYFFEIKNQYVKIKGVIDSPPDKEVVESFLLEIHKSAVENKYREVIVDITELSFISAPIISEFAQWIFNIEASESNSRYTITFICDTTTYSWQESTFSTMVYINSDIVKKEVM